MGELGLIQYVALFALSVIGSVIGINFGGALLFVNPVLLGFGFDPFVVLSSTRPSIIAQSLIGLRLFKSFRDLDARRTIIISLFSFAGAIIGFFFLRAFHENALMIMLGVAFFLGFMGLFRGAIIRRLTVDRGYYYPEQSGAYYAFAGFLPSVFGGILGAGSGIIVICYCLGVLNKKLKNTIYIEKIITLSHGTIIFLITLARGDFEPWVSIVLLSGSVLGSYFGAKLTIALPSEWVYGIILLLVTLIVWRVVF